MNPNISDLLGEYNKLIMDPVHGGIPVFTHEVAIIDHPLFQRLRFICQNDILSLVFPGATHSRFLHSIGAMHVGAQMFRAMVQNRLKFQHRNRTQTEIDVINQHIDPDILNSIGFFLRLVRIACLLHDSGHSSFSHQFSRTPAIRNLLAQENRFKQLWNGIDAARYYREPPPKLEHEHYSVRVAHKILQDIDIEKYGLEKGDILSLMETTSPALSSEFKRHANQLWSFITADSDRPIKQSASFKVEDIAFKVKHMLSAIVSGELDADRADYMLRDGFHSSVTIGGFNLDHLLSNLHFGWCDQTGWLGLAISRKGLGSLEDFVYSRHQMYRQVYAHKTAQGFDWLLRASIEEVLNNPEIFKQVDKGLSRISDFQDLTDNFFWEAFRLHSKKFSQSHSGCILNRIKMRHIASRENLPDDEISTYQSFLAKEYKVATSDVIASSITARFTNIDYNFDAIKVLNYDRSNSVSYQLIAESSQFFSKFKDRKISHFYFKPFVQPS